MSGVTIFWYLFFVLLGGLIGILIGRRIERNSRPPDKADVVAGKPAEGMDPGILRAIRIPAGKTWLEMNGKHIWDKTGLDPVSRQSLLNLVSELSQWVEIEKVAPPNSVNPSTTPAVKIAPNKAEKKEVPPTPPMKSIIEQINDVLQVKLEASALKDRGIQLIEGANGSVIVQDGLKRFEGLEAVPDAEVTALIRSAITEWEKSTK
jgi:hypothetical protein